MLLPAVSSIPDFLAFKGDLPLIILAFVQNAEIFILQLSNMLKLYRKLMRFVDKKKEYLYCEYVLTNKQQRIEALKAVASYMGGYYEKNFSISNAFFNAF